jgi:hypothetical protein
LASNQATNYGSSSGVISGISPCFPNDKNQAMDLQKARLILEKINSLHKSMSSDSRNVSVIEKDLMRNYILQLYETTLDFPVQAKTDQMPQVEIIKTAPVTNIKKSEPLQSEPEKPIAKAQPVKLVADDDPQDDDLPALSKFSQSKTPATHVNPASFSPGDSELEDIFNPSSAKDLADKLSQLPIADIKKAMGVNERIFTINELFGGDQVAFDRAVNSLNSFNNFEEAREYLLHQVANQYNWLEKSRKSKAKNFVKLVKRRYS